MKATRRLRATLFLYFALATSAFARSAMCVQAEPTGTWIGRWERDGSSLAVEMTFTSSADGYTGSFSSDQLRVVGVPLSRVKYEAPSLAWEIVGDETTMVFEGTLRADELAGRLREGAASGSFALTRATSTSALVREDDTTYANGAVTLSGTIVSPAGDGPFAGIVFLHGSGAEGRWASRYLAHEFARRGVAALIYDKRGVGRSTGDWRTAGFEELVGDATAAVDALRSDKRIAADRVGIHGHSQGGTLTPWVASASQHVAFVVASAASGVSMAECEIYSIESSLGVQGMTSDERELAQAYVRAIVATAYDGAPRADLEAAFDKVRGRPWAFAPPPESDPYWAFSRKTAKYDALEWWRRVSKPTLLVYGESDERVPARRSAARIEEAARTSGARLEVILFPGADHNFRIQPNASGAFAWPSTAPGYPSKVVEWVVSSTSK